MKWAKHEKDFIEEHRREIDNNPGEFIRKLMTNIAPFRISLFSGVRISLALAVTLNYPIILKLKSDSFVEVYVKTEDLRAFTYFLELEDKPKEQLEIYFLEELKNRLEIEDVEILDKISRLIEVE